MWKRIVKNKALLLAVTVALVAGGALGVLVGLAVRSSEQEAEQTGRIGIQSVLPTTKIVRQITFERCGHSKSIELMNEAFIGYTRDELQAFYKTCRVSEFTREQVVILQPLATCCPEHVLVRTREDGTLCVYRTDPEFYIEQLVSVLPLSARADMAETERTRLAQGVVCADLEEADAYLESLES